MLKTDFKHYCENRAIELRHELGLYAFDPLPARCLAKHMRVPLLEPHDLGDLQEHTLQQLLASSNWWAVALNTDLPLIIYNPYQAEARFESSIMHELSHLLLKHKPERLVSWSAEYMGRAYPKRNEEEAKFLGACLQVTRPGLDWAKRKGFDTYATAQHFGASVQMVRYRLNTTGK